MSPWLAAVNDDDVMADVKAGSVAAFVVLYERYCDEAYRVAWSVCRDDGRAEEAVQEGFSSIWKTRTTYDSHLGTVAPWVLSVVRYRAIDIARSNGRHVAHRASADILHDVCAPGSVADAAVASVQTSELMSLVDRLPEAQREVIALAFFGQHTHREIATQLGLPIGTVKGRVRLGLRRLRGDIQRVAS